MFNRRLHRTGKRKSRADAVGNRVIVAHGNLAQAATPACPAEGEALVFKPDGDGSFILIDRVETVRWADLLAAVGD